MNALSRAAALLAILLSCVLVVAAHAENFDVYPFASDEQEARFDRLTNELRCPKCQNQSIADSNAPIAQDLRKRTWELVLEGRSDEEIVAYLKARYGEFITYRPAFNAVTALLWGGPFLLLAIVAGLLAVRLRARPVIAPSMHDEEEAARRAATILAEFDVGPPPGEQEKRP